MSRCSHDEIDDVGVKRGVQAVKGLHPCQQAVGDGLRYQDDPHDHSGHHVAPDVVPQPVLGQPAHHREEAGQGRLDSGRGAGGTALHLRFQGRDRRRALANLPLQERRQSWGGFEGLTGLVHRLRKTDESCAADKVTQGNLTAAISQQGLSQTSSWNRSLRNEK